jgi:hypothetical protein
VTNPSEVLHRAFLERAFVVIHRSIEGSEEVAGYVVGIGARWVMLHLASNDVFLTGYAALRLDDVATVEGTNHGHFLPRGLAALNEHPVVPENIHLDWATEHSQALAARFGLLTVHLEFDDPEVCHIGRLMGASGSSLRLWELAPTGECEPEPTTYPVDEVTRFEAGGRYERALALVAGPPPEHARPTSPDTTQRPS